MDKDIKKQLDIIESLVCDHKEYDKIHKAIKKLTKEIEFVEDAKEDTEKDLFELQEKIEGLNIPTRTLCDIRKNEILSDLHSNMSLEDLEHLEMLAAQYLKEVRGQEYFSMNRIINANAI